MKFSALLAGAVAVVGLSAATAHADFVITAVRTTNKPLVTQAGFTLVGGTTGQLVDMITLTITNNGLNGTATTSNGAKTITGIDLTVTTPGTTSATQMIFKATDAVGDGGNSVDDDAELGSAGQNNGAFGTATGSYLRYGSSGAFSNTYNTPTSPGGIFPENRQDPGNTGHTTFDPLPNFTNNHLFEIVGGVTTAGGIDDSTPISLGTIEVPIGTTISINGKVGDGNAALDPVSFTFPATSVPEPASLGLLAVGGLALLARRRKVNA